MQHETIHIQSPSPNTYAIITTTTRPPARDTSESSSRPVKRPDCLAEHTRETLTGACELVLSSLRGEALVAAMLAYGLGVRVSALRDLRVRDICLRDKTIFIAGRWRALPQLALIDLREHLHERVCGREASVVGGGTLGNDTLGSDTSSAGSWRRDDLLFSAHAFEVLAVTVGTVNGQVGIIDGLSFNERFDSAFKILSRLHRHRAIQRGVTCRSPLELFDKGPRIVRRGRGGTIDAYYVWRAARELF